jgi:hypothetical protein
MGAVAAEKPVIDALVASLPIVGHKFSNRSQVEAILSLSAMAARALGTMGALAARIDVVIALIANLRLGWDGTIPSVANVYGTAAATLSVLIAQAESEVVAAFENELSRTELKSNHWIAEAIAQAMSLVGLRLRLIDEHWSVQRIDRIDNCAAE